MTGAIMLMKLHAPSSFLRKTHSCRGLPDPHDLKSHHLGAASIWQKERLWHSRWVAKAQPSCSQARQTRGQQLSYHVTNCLAMTGQPQCYKNTTTASHDCSSLKKSPAPEPSQNSTSLSLINKYERHRELSFWTTNGLTY